MTGMFESLLVIDDLAVEIAAGGNRVRILDKVRLRVAAAEIVGILGETGSGKSMTLMSIMGLVPEAAAITGGRISYRGRDLIGLDPDAYRALRGREIAMVVQNAKLALNPLEPVGKQMRNVYSAKTTLARDQIEAHARRTLARVGFRDVGRVLEAYPHQLSGGMAQRVLMAIALGSSPHLILLDEPTSGLDPTIASHVMQILVQTLRESGASAIVVTHDIGVITRYCDRAVVMSGGRTVDEAPVSEFFRPPFGRERAALIEAAEWAERSAAAGAAWEGPLP
jgi:ABC-type glutathione transport system ATPase component